MDDANYSTCNQYLIVIHHWQQMSSSSGAGGISSSESSPSEPISIKELRMSSAHAMIFLSQQVASLL